MHKIKYLLAATAALSYLYTQSTENLLVEEVNFLGNEGISGRALLSQIELKPTPIFIFAGKEFDRRLLKLDAISLKNYYNSKGFLQATVEDSFSIIQDKVKIFFKIYEGKQYFLNEVQVDGLTVLKKKKVLDILGLKKGSPYNPIEINKNLALVDEALQEKGKLFAKYDIGQIIEDSVSINLNILEGKDIYINESWVTGNSRIDSAYIRKEFAFKKGDLFRKSLMDKTKRILLQAGFFSSVSIITQPITGNDSMVNLEVRVREFQNRGIQDFNFGYEDIEYVPGVNSLLGMGGEVRWTDRMILGSKNRFDASGSIVMPSEEGFIYPRFSLDMKFSNQRPLALKIPTQIKVFYQQFKNFGDEEGPYVKRFGLQYSNIFRWNRQRSFLDIGFRIELFDESHEFKDQIEQRKFKVHLHQDNRNNPMDATQGNMVIFQMDAFGGPLGGNRSYTKFDLDLRQYVTPLKNITLAGRINAGTISGWKTEYDQYEPVLFEKFYLGGSNTLRAWKPLQFLTETNDLGILYPSGKTAKLLTNWEVRFPLFWKLGAVLFYDGGLIADKLSDINQDILQWNRGIGITLNLPFGPIRIDFAESVEDQSLNQFHFGFLYAF